MELRLHQRFQRRGCLCEALTPQTRRPVRDQAAGDRLRGRVSTAHPGNTMRRGPMPATAFSHGQTTRPLRFFSSLRFRLMLWYLLILGIALCAFSAAIYVFEAYTLYQNLDTILNSTIEHQTSSYDSHSAQVPQTNANVLVILQNPQGDITQVMPAVPPPALPALRSDLSQVKDWGKGPLWRSSRRSVASTSPK